MIKTACHIPGDTASFLSVMQVQRWLQRCSATHAKCGSIGLDVPLPTRLINVESGLRLVETKGMHDRYVCLSHCWGEQDSTTVKRTFRTTRENLSSSLKSIDFTSLPRTYTDAITFTRKLGLRFLWIDSLCIIQDNEDDWRHEASLMARIYENAILTLGATASVSDAEGLFRSSSPIHDPIELRGKTSKGRKYTVYARRELPHNMLDEPLFQRGWIFQERYLSPRILHFAPNELIWECREGMDCECNAKKLLATTESDPTGYFNSGKACYMEAFTASPNGVQAAWRDVVRDYSDLNLSQVKDTLPALSGMAKKFIALRPGDRYLAGLWESSFVQDLLWIVDCSGISEKRKLRPRPKKWRAPTWSWASIDSAVETIGTWYGHGDDNGPKITSYLDVLDVNCIPVGEDITGELSGGYALVKGSIMAAYFSNLYDNNDHYIDKEGCEAIFSPDYILDADGESRVQHGDLVSCLRVATARQWSQWSRDDFLILRGKHDMIGTFERIGSMSIVVDDDFQRMFELRREVSTIRIV